jgi:hypothetical protein
MKSILDTIMTNIPIALIILVFIFLIVSEFAGICISGDNVMKLLHGVIIGEGVKVLG